MTVTFIMALAVGAADKIEGRNAIIDGFGLVALVALAPIIMVMILNFLYPGQDPDNEDSDNEEEIMLPEPENNQLDENDREEVNNYDIDPEA